MNPMIFVVLVAAIALIAIVGVRRFVRRGTNDIVAILITIFGTFIGVWSAFITSEHQARSQDNRRLLGYLTGAEKATRLAAMGAKNATEFLIGHPDEDNIEIIAKLIAPDVVTPLVTNGDLFSGLSAPLQQCLPVLGATLQSQKYVISEGKVSDEIAHSMYLRLTTQDSCFVWEIEYEKGLLSEDSLKARVERVVTYWIVADMIGLGRD